MADQYDAKQSWNTSVFLAGEMTFPAEYVIRIFKGRYPRLKLRDNEPFENKKICDVSCGDGANLFLLNQCRFQLFGTEITSEMVNRAKHNLSNRGINDVDIRVGTNDSIPFDNGFFDFLLSWNSCYYMGPRRDFEAYVKEFARVIRKGGYLILSIPKKTCFIFKQAELVGQGYCVIKKDPFGIRNGEVMRIFQNKAEIKETFSSYFKDFTFASVHDDCFGYAYHWHLLVCRRKS